ncbi:suppressor of fused domain protein [Brevibacterium sp. JNUCC-42]|nr:suppressor of fused domain protein [Brevibacterium sp. JNUCC-42]
MFLLKMLLLMISFLLLLFFLYTLSKKQERAKQPEMLKVWNGVVEQAVAVAERQSQPQSESTQQLKEHRYPDSYKGEQKNKQADVTLRKWIKSHYQMFFFDEPVAKFSAHENQDVVTVLLYACNRKRGWFTYATCGCAEKNGAEYIISTYEKHQELPILIEQIIEQALELGSSSFGQLFPCGRPFGAHHGFTHVICLSPVFEPEGFAHFTNGKKLVSIFMLVPLWRSEADFVKQNGWPELEAIFMENDVNTLEWNRASVI